MTSAVSAVMEKRAPAERRQIPRWEEIRPFLQRKPFVVNATERRLGHAHTIEDLRDIARRRTPRAVFDYVDGSAGSEEGIERTRTDYRSVVFHPSVLRDVSHVTPEATILGSTSALPLVLAPTGFTRLMHHEGETAVARAAAAIGIPYTLSTMGTTSIEELANQNISGARHWFQLYLWKNREESIKLVERAKNAGFEALVLTVDTPVGGERLRDVRNGFTIPPTLTARTVAEIATHPTWWFNLLTTRPLEFASLSSSGGTVAELINKMFDASVGVEDLAWLRSQWPGKLVVKGIQSVEDARMVVDVGVDAVILSNHGGRQLDRAASPLRILQEVKAAIGDRAEIIIDTGIMNGADLVTAAALGASAGMVGRAYLYGLMAGGEKGVSRALDILNEQTVRTMALLGSARIAELVPDQVSLQKQTHASRPFI